MPTLISYSVFCIAFTFYHYFEQMAFDRISFKESLQMTTSSMRITDEYIRAYRLESGKSWELLAFSFGFHYMHSKFPWHQCDKMLCTQHYHCPLRSITATYYTDTLFITHFYQSRSLICLFLSFSRRSSFVDWPLFYVLDFGIIIFLLFISPVKFILWLTILDLSQLNHSVCTHFMGQTFSQLK